MEDIRPRGKKPRYDVQLEQEEYLVLRTKGVETHDGKRFGAQYLIVVDAFGEPRIEKELRNYG